MKKIVLVLLYLILSCRLLAAEDEFEVEELPSAAEAGQANENRAIKLLGIQAQLSLGEENISGYCDLRSSKDNRGNVVFKVGVHEQPRYKPVTINFFYPNVGITTLSDEELIVEVREDFPIIPANPNVRYQKRIYVDLSRTRDTSQNQVFRHISVDVKFYRSNLVLNTIDNQNEGLAWSEYTEVFSFDHKPEESRLQGITYACFIR